MRYDKLGQKKDNDPYAIAEEIVEELKEEVEIGNYENMEDVLEYLHEYIEPYCRYYSDCHEILSNYNGDTSYFENMGCTTYDDIGTAYATQAIEQEVRKLLE